MLILGPQELLTSEENMARKLDLDRERNSVAHLAQAKADCKGVIPSHFYLLLVN